MRLKTRVAVITGGGSGIGAAICRAFAEEGAVVAVTDVQEDAAENVAEAICKNGGTAMPWCMDITQKASVEDAADRIENRLGPINTWVNNAGISRIIPFLDCTEEIWDSTLTVNLKGSFLGCQAAIRRMLPRKEGVIINMSSQSGKVGNSRYQAYCASKFGVIGLTQSLAVEFASQGIRVNALCPGVVFTPMWESQLQDYAEKKKMSAEEVKTYWERSIPAGRIAGTGDVAKAAVYLASDDASYIIGQALNISGGAVMH